MVTVGVNTNVFRVIELQTIPFTPGTGAWVAEDIIINTSTLGLGTTIVVDFAITAEAKVQYTLDGTNYVSFNEDQNMIGGQSRYIRVYSGAQLNFKFSGTDTSVNYLIVGEV